MKGMLVTGEGSKNRMRKLLGQKYKQWGHWEGDDMNR